VPCPDSAPPGLEVAKAAVPCSALTRIPSRASRRPRLPFRDLPRRCTARRYPTIHQQAVAAFPCLTALAIPRVPKPCADGHALPKQINAQKIAASPCPRLPIQDEQLLAMMVSTKTAVPRSATTGPVLTGLDGRDTQRQALPRWDVMSAPGVGGRSTTHFAPKLRAETAAPGLALPSHDTSRDA